MSLRREELQRWRLDHQSRKCQVATHQTMSFSTDQVFAGSPDVETTSSRCPSTLTTVTPLNKTSRRQGAATKPGIGCQSHYKSLLSRSLPTSTSLRADHIPKSQYQSHTSTSHTTWETLTIWARGCTVAPILPFACPAASTKASSRQCDSQQQEQTKHCPLYLPYVEDLGGL